MSLACRSFGYFFYAPPSTPFVTDPSSNPNFALTPSGVKTRLLYFCYNLIVRTVTSNVFTNPSMQNQPRLSFCNSSDYSLGNEVFEIIATKNSNVANLIVSDSGYSQPSEVKLPNGGLVFEDGLSLKLSCPTSGVYASHSFNVVYQF